MTWGRKHKYGAVRTADGFPSKLEKAVWEMLRIMQAANEIKDLKRYHTVVLSDAKVRWKCDFIFTNVKTGGQELAEAKGKEDARFRVVKKLYKEYGTMPLQIWKGNYRRPFLFETIKPKGRK